LIRDSLRRRRLLANALLAAAILACAMLILDPPTQSNFYPTCPIRSLLGIDCPGCGATRALAALLHGHLPEALRLNALFVLLLPAALAGAIETHRRAIRPGTFRWPSPPVPAVYATLAATVVFTLVRNLAR
jgi:Protein of unknown function (DUF2752)